LNDLLIDFDGPLEPQRFIARFNANEQAFAVSYRPMEAHDLPDACRGDELRRRLSQIVSDGLVLIGHDLPPRIAPVGR
jgi:hypothetical protein